MRKSFCQNCGILQNNLVQIMLGIVLLGILIYPSIWLVYSGINGNLTFNQITLPDSDKNFQSYYSSETKDIPACLSHEVSVPQATDVRSESHFQQSKTISGIIFCANNALLSKVWRNTELKVNLSYKPLHKALYITNTTLRL